MDDKLQDDSAVKRDLADHERLQAERVPWESTWRDIDDRFPDGAGGFNKASPGMIRGAGNYDSTHLTAVERFAAAGVAITTPEEKQYILPRFGDPELQKLRSVRLWCADAGQRMYNMRYNGRSGFGVAAHEDWDQLGRYGTSVMWNDSMPGSGLFYRTLHLSECYIDVDASGMVDTLHRRMTKTAAQLQGLFGYGALTPKMQKAIDDGKRHTEFELIHFVDPNRDMEPDRLDYRRLPISSRWLAVDEKMYIRRAGYRTYPMSASRHMTSPGEKYGRSPAIKVLPTIQGLNAMRHTTLRAGHKAVDPALVYYDDDAVSRLATKPGGLTRGLIDDQGRLQIARVPGGENGIPYALEMIESERKVIKDGFLEDFYKILTDPNSRMTTTEVLEVMSKQGVLVRPFASRYRDEKQSPMSARDLDMAMRAEQIPPFPPEVIEAGAWPIIDYDNPLAAMARAEQTGKTLRFIEALTPLAQIPDPDGGTVMDWLDLNELVPGMADEIGVTPRYVLSAEQVATKRKARQAPQEAAAGVEQLQGAAGAYLDIARANQLQEAV